MSRIPRCGALVAAAATSLLLPAAALAGTGGASYEEPDVTGVQCAGARATTCAPGASLRVRGENLRATRAVVFLGGKGRADDRRVRPTKATPHRVVARVPSAARSGRVRLIARAASVTGPRVTVRTAPVPPAARPKEVATSPGAGDGVFPILGKHRYGTAVNAFGGGRGHQGQDVFAACGTPLVAAEAGTVKLARWQARAGNYLVVSAGDRTSQVYMHLRAPATVEAGDTVAAGDPIGQVGQTGDAEGCHLHFELWTAPGWYTGGKPVDPLATLKRWDAASAAA